MIKLNLGAGTSRYQDYLGVDLYADSDVQHDLTTPLPYDDDSVDAIYSSHVIEHFTRAEWEMMRQDWARVIRPGGTIELRCPDIRKLCEFYLAEGSSDRIEQIYGNQSDEGQLHKNGFTKEILSASFPNFEPKELSPSSDYELHMIFTKSPK